ncbi:serine/threonine-protein kinase [Streptomyces sp. NBRC 109706]|uniref:serine/threonine-protein kinase n=1 Tax=Streptomyces sp. NBRC 109706 TaxID=1550035 RepID=UPI000783F8C1|nr:serine/threonine-protein kinase [Streptomyces sp. NBRC 109706]
MQKLTPGDPTMVGPYRLLGRLGAGGMGRVYLGRSYGGRLTAVKLVHPGLADDPDFRRRFAREVAMAQRVGGRWTAPVHGADTESELPWVATGYVPGPTLRQVVDSWHGPLPASTLWPLLWGLSEALRTIHAAGLIHRDLKPSNVMVTLDGPMVIDFGVAKAVDASVATRTGAVIGSPGFMAPEQARAVELTTAADVFSLGAVLVHAATGTAPFSGGEVPAHVVLYRILHEEPELGSLDGPLRELAARCLARDPADRPTVEEIGGLASAHTEGEPAYGGWLPNALAARVGREVVRLLDWEGPPAPPTHRPAPFPVTAPATPTPTPTPPTLMPAPPSPSRRGRRAALAASAVAVVAALVVTVVVTRMGDEDEPTGRGPSETPTTEEERPATDDAEQPSRDRLPADILESGEIIVATPGPRPPLSYPDDDGAGVDRELAAAIGELLGVELVFQQVPFQQLEPSLLAGQADLAFDLADTEHTRQQGVDLVDYYRAGDVLLVNEDSGNTTGLSGLCGGTVVTWPGDELTELIEESVDNCDEGVEVRPMADELAMFEAVRNGMADGALVSYLTAAHHTGEGGAAEDLVMAGEQWKVIPFGIAVSGDEEQLRDVVQEALQTLMDDGTYAEIMDRYGLADCAVAEPTVNSPE